ncbi:MAG: hypothetical protein L3K17_00620 [Thermoplasmata archaeon]|nr:hypothetical protein [Thermoplasmata archaeon]
MPIDRPEFDAGEKRHPVQRQIEEFLADHPTMAFSAEEIAVAIGHPAGSPIGGANEVVSASHLVLRLAFISELDWMALEGKIERRVVRTPSGHLTFYAPRSVS